MREVLTGIIAGTISGTGMGGGTFLILILSLFLGIEQHIAQATNLIFFIPTSIAAIIVSLKEKLIEWKLGLNIACSGIIGAVIGAKFSININMISLKKYFGIFLAIISIYEIYTIIKEYKSKKKRENI